ncbi:hypothetical protein AB0A95_30550 [Micromonospora sp. NPDC049230]|uniref:hypothetical protein n=1 Tax=Micromonospora sp. NPDC049230 TaxID=3155502 RepID=UPI0033C26628
MTDRQRRAVAQASWRALVLTMLTLVAGWDAIGLLIGDSAYASPSYDVLRVATPWGMRAYGPALLVLLGLTAYALGRYQAGEGLHGYRLLRVCLSLLAAWYTGWAAGIVGAWWVHWQILAWGAPGKLAAIAVVLLILARTTPAERIARGG